MPLTSTQKTLRGLLLLMLQESLDAEEFVPKGSMEPPERMSLSFDNYESLALLAGFKSLAEAAEMLVSNVDKSKLN